MPPRHILMRPPPTMDDFCSSDKQGGVNIYPSMAPWLWQPSAGLPFNPTNYVALPAIAAQAVIVEFRVPEGHNGVINQMGNNFVGGGFVDGSGTVVWRLLVDGVPYPNFGTIIASLGNPAAPSFVGSVRIYEKQLVQLVATNVAIVVAGQLVGGRLSGWFFPRKLEDINTFF